VLTAALIIGVVVSLLLTELVGLSAGGIIVPGYVALLLDRPAALMGFLVVAGLSYAILRGLGRVLMLFGARRFAIAVLAGMTLSVALQWATQWAAPALVPTYVEWVGLGLIVPGLLAHQFDRQGVLPTLLMLAIAGPLVRLILILAVPQ
jgi:poly-gamma-glutamate biosynthesis protein PgsC/CapC